MQLIKKDGARLTAAPAKEDTAPPAAEAMPAPSRVVVDLERGRLLPVQRAAGEAVWVHAHAGMLKHLARRDPALDDLRIR